MDSFEKWNKLPLFKKAIDVQKIVKHIAEVVEKSDINFEKEIQAEMIMSNVRYLRENSLIIPAKIAGAADDDTPYDLRMENAAIIRKAARELITDVRGIEMHGFKDIAYLDILRNEVDEFRILFTHSAKRILNSSTSFLSISR